MVPAEYIGDIMKLGQERRGVYGGMEYVDPTRVEFHFEFPLAEIIFDFYDKLKSITRGLRVAGLRVHRATGPGSW